MSIDKDKENNKTSREEILEKDRNRAVQIEQEDAYLDNPKKSYNNSDDSGNLAGSIKRAKNADTE